MTANLHHVLGRGSGFATISGPTRSRDALGKNRGGKFRASHTPTLIGQSENGPQRAREDEGDLVRQLERELVRTRAVRDVVRVLASWATNAAGRTMLATGLFPALVFEGLAISTAERRRVPWEADLTASATVTVRGVDAGDGALTRDGILSAMNYPTATLTSSDGQRHDVRCDSLAFLDESLSHATSTDPLLFDCDALVAAGGPVALAKRFGTLLHDAPPVTGSSGGDVVAKDDLAQRHGRRALAEVKAAVVKALSSSVQPNHDANPARVSHSANNLATVSWGKHSHTLQAAHLDKLKQLFRGHEDDFAPRVFLLLQRYYNVVGADASDAEGGWHGAVPARVMRQMQASLGVACECFASPFNCTFVNYHSAFADTDGVFGSRGSFFDAALPSEGSYEANPPFDHAVALRMAQRMDAALRASSAPLSFLVVLPCADRGKPLASLAPVLSVLRASGYLRADVTLDAAATDYVDGMQQCTADSGFVARLDTGLFLLQNDAGAAKWPAAGVDDIAACWRGEQATTEHGAKKRPRGDDTGDQ
jgi:hypothetical protein